MDQAGTWDSPELQRLQETNEALSFDMKAIIDNKMRVEKENYMLKKEI
jgi:hypothetical protein